MLFRFRIKYFEFSLFDFCKMLDILIIQIRVDSDGQNPGSVDERTKKICLDIRKKPNGNDNGYARTTVMSQKSPRIAFINDRTVQKARKRCLSDCQILHKIIRKCANLLVEMIFPLHRNTF